MKSDTVRALRRVVTSGWFAATVVAVLGAVSVASVARDVETPVALDGVAYVQSATCVRCHPGHEASWRATFHRTMTQVAGPDSVVGDFDDASFTFEGVTSRFTRDGDDFFVETLGTDGRMHRFHVDRTVGSRRIQQYVTRDDDRYIRLPVAWNIGERRWFHLDGGFLDPDGIDFNTHTTVWDGNCIFCHNVKAQPGYDWESKRFSSRVAELGIACEACHGPGAEHISRNANPVRRYYLYTVGEADPTIVNPSKLAKERQLQICGHCHGQRLPNPVSRIREFMTVGDPFTAGADLGRFTTPIEMDSTLEGVDLKLRFWKDGTPRLTAYEYQGLLATPDYQKGGLTCISCHSAHGGDPRGMIAEEMRGPSACASCHAGVVSDASHTKHLPGSSGSNCYACHMPKITYGILDVHPTHRIRRPDPSRAWRYDMPEACTLCHTDRTAPWAAEETARLWGRAAPADVPSTPDFRTAENVRALLGGDVVQRAVAALAFGDPASYASDPVARLWAVPFLTISLEDRYPAVRAFAYRSIRALVDRAAAADPGVARAAAGLPWFDPQADAAARAEAVARMRAWWDALDKRGVARPGDAVPLDDQFRPDAAVVQALARSADEHPISIGE